MLIPKGAALIRGNTLGKCVSFMFCFVHGLFLDIKMDIKYYSLEVK